jgi:uncharacterized RDD family membrane protein YckC
MRSYEIMSGEAGLGSRFLARLLDGFLVSTLLATLLFGIVLNSSDRRSSSLVVSILLFVYEFVAISQWGQTRGKRPMRLRVMDYTTGAMPSAAAAAIRAAVLFVPALPTSFVDGVARDVWNVVAITWSLAVVASILWDSDNRGLHDRAAGTVVVAATPSD